VTIFPSKGINYPLPQNILPMSCAKIALSWLDDWGATPTTQIVLGALGWSNLLSYAYDPLGGIEKNFLFRGDMFHVEWYTKP